MQSKVSTATVIEVVTEGVFTRMILDDPALDGVAAVLFDEFHERSLDADLGLAFAIEAQGLLRPELRLLVMSATLDGARVAELLKGAPIIESQGRAFPVETHYLGRDPRQRLEEDVARAVARALSNETGSVLVFLPGQGEIRRVETLLSERIKNPAVLAPLYGAMDGRDQDRAIEPAPPGARKVVLATSIAETSLTIEGVRVVIDSGFSRVPRYDPASGLTRLETVRVARAAADQRRGRAGRTEAGVCYRLWDEAETRALIPFARPEILETDLSRLALDLARWGARDASALGFLDPPPAGAMAEARSLLTRLDALDAQGALTAHGRAIAAMPLAPRLAHMVVLSRGERAARIAAVLSERGLGGSDADLTHRLAAFDRDQSQRAREARALASRWAKGAGGRADLSDGALLGLAFPERIAKARGKPGEYQLASGRGVYLEPTDILARAPWLAVGELGGGAVRDRILLAAALDEDDLAAFDGLIEIEDRIEPDDKGRVRARRLKRLGKLVVEERLIDDPDSAMIAGALLGQVRARGLGALPFGAASGRLRSRLAFIESALTNEVLMATLDEWLEPLLIGKRSLAGLNETALEAALRALISWDVQRRLEAEAPERFTAPTGNRFVIDYAAEGGPRVEVRVGELYGLSQHPMVGGVPLTFSLLSPGHKPIQTTRDIPGFWKGSWADVRKDMRGRYPRHVWPEDPASAVPVTRAKPRGT